MNTRRDRMVAVQGIARALPIALIAAALWILRPGPPQLPESLTGPVTVEQLEQTIVFLGWLALIILLALAAVRLTRATPARPGLTSIPEPPSRVRSPITRIGQARAPIDINPTLTVLAPPDTNHATDAGPDTTGLTDMHVDASRPRPGLRISLLGSFSIDGIEGSARGMRSSTEQLIAYLALHPRGASRDELVEAIWPGEDPRRTRPRLWQSTSEARKLIGDAFISQRGHYSLDHTNITIDAYELETLLAKATAASTPAAQRRIIERGLQLLRGEPLAGQDHVWADTHATRLRAIQTELLERLARDRLATGDPHGALQAAELGLSRDSLNEALWRLAMQAETELGLRDAVARRYQRLRALLDEQLGLEPETATRTLYRQLLEQR